MNVLKPHQQATIATLLANKVSQREIQRKTGIDRKTIRKYASSVQGEASNSSLATDSCGGMDENPPPWPPGPSPLPAQETSRVSGQGVSACEPHREWIEKQVALGRNATTQRTLLYYLKRLVY